MLDARSFVNSVNLSAESSLKFNCASTSSGGANELHTITQAIEGNMIADFGFGGGNARDMAISFWVKSSLT